MIMAKMKTAPTAPSSMAPPRALGRSFDDDARAVDRSDDDGVAAIDVFAVGHDVDAALAEDRYAGGAQHAVRQPLRSEQLVEALRQGPAGRLRAERRSGGGGHLEHHPRGEPR